MGHKKIYITKRCMCDFMPSICPVCNLITYKKFHIKYLNYSSKAVVFKNIDNTCVTGYQWRRELDRAFMFIGLTPKYPYWRAHSLRHGEIADMMAAQINYDTLQKNARHVPGSKATHIYTKIKSHEEADIIHNRMLYKYIQLEFINGLTKWNKRKRSTHQMYNKQI